MREYLTAAFYAVLTACALLAGAAGYKSLTCPASCPCGCQSGSGCCDCGEK
jgi:hypothetical protein